MISAEELIRLLNLQPLAGEGGFFRETWRASEGARDDGPGARTAKLSPLTPHASPPVGTAIYYLLTPDTFSALHRLPGDEIFHFYLGDAVTMLQLHPDGQAEQVTLGPDLASGQQVQVIVPGGTWQGSLLLPGGRFALMGTTMAPGFDPQDLETGSREQLLAAYPSSRELILKLTR